MPQYTVHAVEELIDAFEEVEGYQELPPITIHAGSLQEAKQKASGILNSRVTVQQSVSQVPPGGALATRVFKIVGNGEIWQHDLPERL